MLVDAMFSRSSGECTPSKVGPNEIMLKDGMALLNKPHSNPAWIIFTSGILPSTCWYASWAVFSSGVSNLGSHAG